MPSSLFCSTLHNHLFDNLHLFVFEPGVTIPKKSPIKKIIKIKMSLMSPNLHFTLVDGSAKVFVVNGSLQYGSLSSFKNLSLIWWPDDVGADKSVHADNTILQVLVHFGVIAE